MDLEGNVCVHLHIRRDCLEAVNLDIEALASKFWGATMCAFRPQPVGSPVTKMKEEEMEWHL